MILQTALALTGIGFIAWVLGTIFGYTEIAVIGAALIVGTGAMIMTTGLQFRDGELRQKTFTNETGPDGNETLVNNETDIDYQYSTLTPMEEFQVGLLWLLLGTMLVLRPFNALNES